MRATLCRQRRKKHKTFVANRVSAIREQSLSSQWRYVGTKANPADDASRGLPAEAFSSSNRWNRGPVFLWENQQSWPTIPTAIGQEIKDEDVEEVKTSFASLTNLPSRDIVKIFERFSSWFSLLRFVAWMLRFKTRLRNAVAKRKQGKTLQNCAGEKTSPLQVHEIEDAKKVVIKAVQECCFHEEISSLKTANREGSYKEKGSGGGKKSSSISKLDPVLLKDVICVGDRLQRSTIDDDAKHPAILPKQHQDSDLIIQHYHLLCGHSGLEHTLSMIREKYWIVQARISLRRVLSKCFDCKRRQASLGKQKMASLPEDRVRPSKPPFTNVGVDCFGPMFVRHGRSTVKRYGVLFTCLSVRAVHIEVVHSLDTDAFINALRRFISRRSHPQQISSDNDGNFVKGERDLREAVRDWNQQKIHEFLLAKNIEWIFNPPTSSRFGGVWDRCIRTVRKVMTALLKEQPLDDEGLLTLMCEEESVVNGRPITKVSDDPRDPEALTPNHLLLLRSGPMLPPELFVREDTYSLRRWRQVQYLADVFWRRRIREYLPAL